MSVECEKQRIYGGHMSLWNLLMLKDCVLHELDMGADPDDWYLVVYEDPKGPDAGAIMTIVPSNKEEGHDRLNGFLAYIEAMEACV